MFQVTMTEYHSEERNIEKRKEVLLHFDLFSLVRQKGKIVEKRNEKKNYIIVKICLYNNNII